ncbi:PhoX family protein [Methylibium petroleiphilum]|uniref:PhoX family protein n=1 Tax=Methylibium petroleiphilum TaxID=105560 RepID=UPI001AC263CA|nr:PhoX family phosphatase [Methylibium petroleiphilum]MBN9203368.1 PhoX family phosphatase [Methylibium petroleiphilum]
MNQRVDLPLLGIDRDDENSNTSGNDNFMAVLDARLSRRSVLRGGVGTAAAVVLGGLSVSACGGGDNDDAPPANPPVDKLGFTAVAKSTADAVSVPAGYTAAVIYALGDPLTAGTPAYANDGSDTDFDQRAGDHHDGMEYFGLNAAGTARDANGSERGLLAMNHEALSDNYLHVNGSSARPRPASESDKEIPAHGVSVVEVRKTGSSWAYVQDSAYNRRVTPLTPVELSGAVRGNALAKTLYSTAGTGARGTINNCGTGYTPWGTLLTGEENFEGYFTRSAGDDAARGDKSVTALNRYKRKQGAASRHGWETSGADDKYQRWDISKIGASADGSDDYRNELNTFGYIVEIDPYDKAATIKKRTTLGRFAHESAAFGKAVAGKPLAVYMGDDSRGEYIYKFVSATNWDAADAEPSNRIAAGDKYLDGGKLYVAKFNDDGSGDWIELSFDNLDVKNYAGYAFADAGDVAIHSRLAGDAVGATAMDRPEWCAVHPTTGEIYYTLTNNSVRKLEPAAPAVGASPDSIQRALDAANPRSYKDSYGGAPEGSAGNINGHIIRMKEDGGEPAATGFTWDVYLFGAQSDADTSKINLSSLTADQDFSSPDGLWFSRSTGLCWIQTDDGAYTDVSNCMMLLGVPGTVGDGVKTTLSYTLADTSTLSIDTYVGKKPTADTLKRFLVGPKDCELTGCTETPDGKTVFANIQHPGETISAATIGNPAGYVSHWPGNAGYQATAGNTTSRPRSATLAITKDDGGRVGA